MMRINDREMLDRYISKYHINEIFNADMSSFMELLLFRRNEYICRENEEISYFFFFVEGKAKVYSTLSNGKALLLCFYQGFKVLGDLEFINMQTASTNVQVIEDTYCIGIPMEKARAQMLGDASFMRFICGTLAEKLNRLSKNSSINLLYPLENRLAGYILATGESAGRRAGIMVFDENLTEISELLGTSYRHLLRTLNVLCDKGAIVKKHSCFEVADEKVLRGLAGDLYM